MSRSVAHARWVRHINGVWPSRPMRDWLIDRRSLTRKLIECSQHFCVRRLHQKTALCLRDEFAVLGLPQHGRVREREVLLQCDGVARVYAHTVMPLQATAADWPFFKKLGERSLGTTLFGDPLVARGALHFARLRASHPLVRRACCAVGVTHFDSALYARRCLFQRKNGMLLVTEVFLPALLRLGQTASIGQPDRAVLLPEALYESME